MNLTEQVCSLELAKRLKELGVKGLFTLFRWDEWQGISQLRYFNQESEISGEIPYAAFTVAELGEILPIGVLGYKGDDGWYMPITHPIHKWNEMYPCKTEADARAIMVIYLIEQGLLNVANLSEHT